MIKRLFIFFASLIALFSIGFLIFLFMFYYEPTPNKGDVEKMVSERNLLEFGEVEGSYLLTPRNYGFYNDGRIYIVEQYLDKGGDYDNQYVVIEEGIELTGDDEQAINQIKNKFILQEDFQIISKYQMTVYKNNEITEEYWLFKITYKYDGEYFLSFLLPEYVDEDSFNFFADGYKQFLQF